MPKRKEPELDPKEQFKRFKKAAHESELDAEGIEHAEEAFNDFARRDQAKKKKD